MFTIKRLVNADAYRYAPLTFRYMSSHLHRVEDEPAILAIGAEWDANGQAVGLVVVEHQMHARAFHIVSLFVDAQYRRQGIGSALVEEVETCLRKIHNDLLAISYYAGKSNTPAMESFLSHTGWAPPKRSGTVYKADSRIRQAPWLKPTGFPNPMQWFFWRDIDLEEKKRLLKLENVLYPPYLSPFKQNLDLEETNSLALLVEGETVGWCITYRLDEDTILYDNVFIKPEYQLSGCSFNLLGRSITLQLDQQIPYAMFAVNESSTNMRAILDRWLAPYTCQVSEKRSSIKKITW